MILLHIKSFNIYRIWHQNNIWNKVIFSLKIAESLSTAYQPPLTNVQNFVLLIFNLCNNNSKENNNHKGDHKNMHDVPTFLQQRNLFLFLPLLVFCCCCYCFLYATPCENANDPGTHTHADMHTRALTVWFVTLSARCLALSLPLSFTCANVNWRIYCCLIVVLLYFSLATAAATFFLQILFVGFNYDNSSNNNTNQPAPADHWLFCSGVT